MPAGGAGEAEDVFLDLQMAGIGGRPLLAELASETHGERSVECDAECDPGLERYMRPEPALDRAKRALADPDPPRKVALCQPQTEAALANLTAERDRDRRSTPTYLA